MFTENRSARLKHSQTCVKAGKLKGFYLTKQAIAFFQKSKTSFLFSYHLQSHKWENQETKENEGTKGKM